MELFAEEAEVRMAPLALFVLMGFCGGGEQ